MGIGESIRRQDAIEKVTGTAKYTEDLVPADALVAKIVHSTIANGCVTSINTKAAEALEGVVAVVTCFDVPEVDFATAGHPYSLDPDYADIKDRRLLNKRVRYYGDDVAVVVAVDELTAQKAVELVEVAYEVYPPILSIPNYGSNPPIHDGCPNNVLGEYNFHVDASGNIVQTPNMFGKSHGGAEVNPDLVDNVYNVPPVHHAHLEKVSCFAYKEGRRLTVVSSTQIPHIARRIISEALDDIPLGDIRVIKPYVGGGFGNKQDVLYEPLAAYLSNMLGGTCVSIILSREETFQNSRTRHGMRINVNMNFTDNRLHFSSATLYSNSGSYAAHGHAIAESAITNLFQLYPLRPTEANHDSMIGLGKSVTFYTNMPTAGAMRGYGIPQMCFAVESYIDYLARNLNYDALELRRKNMMRLNDVDPFIHITCKSNGLDKCMDKGIKEMDWYRKRAEYQIFNQSSCVIKKGIGMAIFAYKTSVYPISVETASCRMVLNQDGSVQVQIGATEIGQGSDTGFNQMASEILTIPSNKIHVVSMQDTDVTPFDTGSYASRQSYVSGGAVKKAALLLVDKILSHASEMTGISVTALRLIDEHIVSSISGEILLSIGEVMTHALYINNHITPTEHITAESTYTGNTNVYAFGACFVDIEVDVPIGKIHIKRIMNVHDSGKIINPQLAQAQLHGGMAMGIGYALGEQMQFDQQTGQLLNPNFRDYKIPTSMDIPDLETAFVETFEPSGPFGNKGVGEPPLIPVAPAIRNALQFATGVNFTSLPLSPDKLIANFIENGIIQEIK